MDDKPEYIVGYYKGRFGLIPVTRELWDDDEMWRAALEKVKADFDEHVFQEMVRRTDKEYLGE